MNNETTSIYGDRLPEMERALADMLGRIEAVREKLKTERGEDPVEHCLSRIKTDRSLREKLRRKGLPETLENALTGIHDAIGIRIVCPFLDDVYAFRDQLTAFPDCTIYREKDYIRHAKSTGYRNLHLVLFYRETFYIEIQLRTISMDTWAALQHQLQYKKSPGPSFELIRAELKRCADELASTDISMQTIRHMLEEERETS